MQISLLTRSKVAARTAYNRMSHFYDLMAGSSETQLMQIGLEMLAVCKGETVLEIGFGTGKALVEIAKKVGEIGVVYGIDLSPGMLHHAHTRLAKAGLQQYVMLIEGDGVHLPCYSASFRAVFLCFTLELFDISEIPLVLAECQRVLAPGGRLGVVAMLKTTHPNRIVRLYEWFHTHLPSYVDCRPIETDALIQAAGFKINNSQVSSMWGLPVRLAVATKS